MRIGTSATAGVPAWDYVTVLPTCMRLSQETRIL